MRRTSQWFLILAITLGLFMPAAVPSTALAAATPVFINEIHYDNDGTDSGEAIEIAGPAGTDLTGWSLVLYNGNGGAVYDTDALSGTIPDQQSGYGTVVMNYPANGIQNGAPDGIALVNASNAVIQFLSYEGSFTAVGGPADGITSVDIGVSEPSDAAVGSSLQLSGTGAVYEDFTWSAPAANTFGAVNSGQTFGGGPVGPSVIINEVDADNPGTDAAEFVELYDGGIGNTSLDGLVVVFYNGSNDLSYAAYDLDGYMTDANGYFLLGNTALTPGITFAGNFLQNGQDAVALYQADAADFPTNTSATTTNLIDAIVYDTSDADDPGLLALLNAGQPQVDENANDNGATESNQRCPNGSGGARNTNTYDQWAPTARAANTCMPPPEACGDPFTPIYEVQGNGMTSPVVDTEVAVEGIVVGDFQNNASPDNGNLNGFHIQDPTGDGDAATSDGVFVYYSNGAIDVAVGDAVRVRGKVSEYNGMTEITVSQLWVCSSGSIVEPTPLSLPVASVDDFEPYEGMLVTFPQALVIAEYFNFDRYGEIVLTFERHLTPTAEFEPGIDAIAAAQEFLLDRITLDDGRTAQNPDPAIHPNGSVFDLSNLFRGGDTVTNVTGVLDYSFDLYRIQPVEGADYASANLRTAAPNDVGGTLKVASFNVLNYFTTIDTGAFICGPVEDQECRGADTPEEFTRQRAKIIAALSAIDADVVGLIEIENHPFDVPTADLVAGLNDMMGAGTYDYIVTNAIGTDAIRQALIYKPAAVTPWGGYAVLNEFVDPRFLDDYNRPVLAQSFLDPTTGGVFTVAVN
ncbi:MAG: ExeM/NucH family extracellular endonuclease, partial [Planctomycetes bacterium]|nr:ExeM/NucH family extracellular endonuclease [Planctomycetota bacterium]